MSRNVVLVIALTLAFEGLVLLPGCHHDKSKNPITRDMRKQGPSDGAMDDNEHNRFARAQLTWNTLINTYGGSAGDLSRAEAEYEDFILFYPRQAADTGKGR